MFGDAGHVLFSLGPGEAPDFCFGSQAAMIQNTQLTNILHKDLQLHFN